MSPLHQRNITFAANSHIFLVLVPSRCPCYGRARSIPCVVGAIAAPTLTVAGFGICDSMSWLFRLAPSVGMEPMALAPTPPALLLPQRLCRAAC